MAPELVTAATLGLVVFLGLALHEPIAERIATLDSDPDLVDPDDLD